MRHREKQDGLTLIDLLLVVVILSILAALVIPLYSQVQNRAKANVLATNLRAFNNAYQLAISELDFPPASVDLLDYPDELANYISEHEYHQVLAPVQGVIYGVAVQEYEGQQATFMVFTTAMEQYEVVSRVDAMIDDGDPNGGRLHTYIYGPMAYNLWLIDLR